uniref:Uncharacterized protein n=1 Tax=Theileria annulata TaxID=5874 RepID=A0A3B0MNH8_THEAN
MFNLLIRSLIVLLLVKSCFPIRFNNYRINSLFINNFNKESCLLNELSFEEYDKSSRFINKLKESSSKGNDNSGEVEDSNTHPGDNESNKSPEGNIELTISKRMLNSILSLTSSFYEPDFYDIIPILYNIKDEVINMTEYMGKTQVKTSQRKHPVKVYHKHKDKTYKINEEMYNKINGMFMNDSSGEVESLVLSIPSSIMNRLYQSSNYEQKPEDTMPIQLVTLTSGFLTRLYEIAIFPYFSKMFQNCFNTTLDNTYGFMYRIIKYNSAEETYIKSDYETGKEKIPGFFLTLELEKTLTEEFEKILRKIRIKTVKELDLNVFTKDSLRNISVLIKCIKDLVFFNSSLKLLEQLIGRKPTDNEIIFSFFRKSQTHPRKNNETVSEVSEPRVNHPPDFNAKKLVQIINDSEYEIEHRLDFYFTPFIEAIINIYKRRINPNFFKVMISCFKDALDAVTTRLYEISPKRINDYGTNFILDVFLFTYNQVKLSALRQNLPEHLPIGTLRLAKKGLKLYEYLEPIQGNMIYRHKKKAITKEELESLYKEDVDDGQKDEDKNDENRPQNPYSQKFDIDDKKFNEFLRKIIEIEDHFNKRGGDKSCNDYMRRQQQDEHLKNSVANFLNVTPDRLSEAIDAYYSKEVGPTDRIPRYLRSRLSPTGRPGKSPVRYYGELEPYEVYDRLESVEYFRDMIYRRTLRKLAMEALDDRVARILFMAQNSLFCEVHPDYEEVIADLKIPKRTADFIAFAATLMCKQYEVWRIKLNLPPYVNEFRINPSVLMLATLDPNNLPHHISTTMYNRVKGSYSSALREEPTQIRGAAAKNKRDRFNRMRLIKPNMSDMTESFMNYKANYKEYEQILLRSPIYYLQYSGIMN